MKPSRCVVVVLMAALAACSGKRDTPSKEPPVPAGPPADCGAVGERLAAFELGNYAPVEERAPKVAAMRTLCEAQHLSAGEGACLVAATDTWSAASCPRPLLPSLVALGKADCAVVTKKLRGLIKSAAMNSSLPPNFEPTLAKVLAVVENSCRKEPWPLAVRGCMLQLPDDAPPNKLEDCTTLLDQAMRDRLDSRMKEVMSSREDPLETPVPEVPVTDTSECDDFVRARRRLDRCEVVPFVVRASLATGLARLGVTNSAVCAAAASVYTQLSTALRCPDAAQ